MEQNDKNEGAANSQMSMLYKDRTEWKDVEPIYNRPEENAVCRIATSEEFDDAFAYLRAVLNSNEFSERTLELTKTCIFLNPANYTVWEFRRQILRALGSNIQEELNYCGEVITENPKNYQVWHHRKTLIGDFDGVNLDGELEFVAFQLQDEPKNYHAWQYRQWLVEHFNLYSLNEINFSTKCLLEDIRNNSAWNYRYFIGANLSECFKPEKFLQSEIDFTLACIRKAPSNESAWSYLSGILLNDQLGPDRPEIVKCCEELLARSPPCHSSHLRIFLIDSIVERLRNGVKDEQKLNEYLGKANQHLDILEQIDPIRHNFWVYKRNYLHNLFSS